MDDSHVKRTVVPFVTRGIADGHESLFGRVTAAQLELAATSTRTADPGRSAVVRLPQGDEANVGKGHGRLVRHRIGSASDSSTREPRMEIARQDHGEALR